jgi:hypothetical protein
MAQKFEVKFKKILNTEVLKMKKMTKVLTFIISFLLVSTVMASDREKEQQWASQVIEFLVDGEPVWLRVDEQEFLGIYTAATRPDRKAAVILIHGGGLHPDWPQVIQPLRTSLPNRGFATLSLQMPVLPEDASHVDYVPLFSAVPARLQAGLDYLAEKNIRRVILVGQSLGSNMASDFLAHHHDERIKGFIGINMSAQPQPAKLQVLDNVVALLKMKVPVLDIYGSQSIEPVLNSVDRRAYVIYQMDYLNSRQVEISGANQQFQGFEDQLLESIVSWITEHTGVKQRAHARSSM